MNLSTYVREDLKQKIQSGTMQIAKMTLESISANYGVSITIARAAINKLIQNGTIIKQRNKRPTINVDIVDPYKEVKVIKSPTLQNDWDKVLLKEVKHASLHSEAVYLREYLLTNSFYIGRSIVRQSLNRFSGAGLIEYKPHKDWMVQLLKEADVLLYIELWEILELKALELSIPLLLKSDLEMMLKNHKSKEKISKNHLDNSLHQYIIYKSKNKFILNHFNQYVPQYFTILFDFAAPEISVDDEMSSQHKKILEFLIEEKFIVAA
jgi:DNA-binding GntR family transcriptional regulator